ncbi:MAG: pentapeptide repeat-containing protein [Methanothrix sp.]|nr:pentapeptide repeat-containing protein [Methanothrix sp.]
MISSAECTILAALLLLTCGSLAAEPGAPERSIQAQDLVAAVRSGEALSYDNITITGEMNLSGLQGPVRQPIRITNSHFRGPARFEGVVFSEPLEISGCTFQDNVSFAKAQFLGDARLSGTRFLEQADFGYASFGGVAYFTDAQFLKDCSFGSVVFGGDAIFSGSTFDRDVDFNFAQFSRLSSFWNASFEDVSFLESQFAGHTTFLDARFYGNATFAGTRFESDVVFRSAQFLEGSTFGLSSFEGLADFGDVHFNRTAFFGGVKFSDLAYFVNSRFEGDLIMEEARFYSMRLDNATFADGSRIDLDSADFTKFVVHWDVIRERMVYNGAAYLALVKNYRSLEWFDDADDCYYQYRRISQDREPWGWAKLYDIISWLSCGYGVRVSYTIFWCLFTILFFGVIFWAGKGMNKFEIEGVEIPGNSGLRPSSRVSLTDAMYFSIAMFTTSQAPVNTYPVGFYRHLAMAEGILGWFFLGLFVVVLSGVLIR